ncbi:hypothetical protein BGC_54590 [Burkholderia sp. 3C]
MLKAVGETSVSVLALTATGASVTGVAESGEAGSTALADNAETADNTPATAAAIRDGRIMFIGLIGE